MLLFNAKMRSFDCLFGSFFKNSQNDSEIKSFRTFFKDLKNLSKLKSLSPAATAKATAPAQLIPLLCLSERASKPRKNSVICSKSKVKLILTELPVANLKFV